MSRLPPPALEWVGGADGYLSLIDQTLLPGRYERLAVRDVKTLWLAIRRLAVRGAPAIGVAAAYGVLLGARSAPRRSVTSGSRRGPDRDASETTRSAPDGARKEAYAIRDASYRAIDYLKTSRPTAVNLFWALDRMRAHLDQLVAGALRESEQTWSLDREVLLQALYMEARAIHQEDAELCQAIGRHGAGLLGKSCTILTHCNAGSLATGGSGTALSVIYEAARQGKEIDVYADETRPLLQGARLTAWELRKAGIPVTLICDNAAASVFAAGKIDAVIVGADRIARNGDVANKIGTYGVALMAHAHDVPFFVAAPSSTFDLKLRSGAEIPIEERSEAEVVEGFGCRSAPAGVRAFNPAFDVTPARLVTALITEAGVIHDPSQESIRKVLGRRMAGS